MHQTAGLAASQPTGSTRSPCVQDLRETRGGPTGEGRSNGGCICEYLKLEITLMV